MESTETPATRLQKVLPRNYDMLPRWWYCNYNNHQPGNDNLNITQFINVGEGSMAQFMAK